MLLQQLLVEAFDLLDPACLRIMPSRRMRLSPVAYKPLPNVRRPTRARAGRPGPARGARADAGRPLLALPARPPPSPPAPPPQLEAYQARLSMLSGAVEGATNFEALANLRDPLAVARRGGALAREPTPPAVPWLAWPPGNGGSGGGSAGRSPGGGSPGGAAPPPADVAASLARAAGALDAAGAGVLASKLPPGSRGGSRGGSSAGSPEPVLPLAEVQEQMNTPHARGGAGGAPNGQALLQDVIGASMVQRLLDAQERAAAQHAAEAAAAARAAAARGKAGAKGGGGGGGDCGGSGAAGGGGDCGSDCCQERSGGGAAGPDAAPLPAPVAEGAKRRTHRPSPIE